jgi:hypothetical protein
VTPAEGVADDWKAKFEEERGRLAKMETDLNRMKSSLQSDLDTLERERQAERERYQQELDSVKTVGMDDAQRLAYENQRYQERLAASEARTADLNARLQEQEQLGRYLQMFREAGVSSDELPVDQGLSAVVAAGWEKVVAKGKDADARTKAFEERIARLEQGAPLKPAPLVPGSVTPPAIVAGTPGGQPVKETWAQVKARLNMTGAEVMHEIEEGRLPETLLPGLQS